MTIFKKKNGLLVGIPEIDAQHLHLIGLVNVTYTSFLDNHSPEILNHLFFELFDYATYHFHAEEQLMIKHGYPGFDDHQNEHVEFARRVTEIHKDYLKGKPAFLEILTFLATWLENHMFDMDKKMGNFLLSRLQ